MATLYIDHSGTQLELDHGALALRRGGELQKRIPLTLLERVVISAGVEISSRLIAALGSAGIGLLFYNPRQKAWAMVAGAPGGDGRRRLGQARMALEEESKNAWARRWVRGKALGQARLLRLHAGQRPAARMTLLSCAERIERAAGRLRAEALSAETARGVEGAASAAYFEGLQAVIPPSLEFHGRNRRPPRDPVNAALSLLYTLVYGAALEAAVEAGLDPAIGYLHEPAAGRAGLACDLMEPLRPAADMTVIRLFQERILRKDHFHTDNGACLLGKAGRQAFYAAVEDDMGRIRGHLRKMARVVARAADRASGSAPGAQPCEREEEEPDAAALH